MRLLLDECVPKRAKFLFTDAGHWCQTVQETGLNGKENGELLALAERQFDVLVTIDRNIRHQQNISDRNIPILIIRVASSDLQDVRRHVPQALEALATIKQGQFAEVGL